MISDPAIAEANARLIAAAPDLLALVNSAAAILECVQTGTAYPESIQHMIDDLRAAIARATS